MMKTEERANYKIAEIGSVFAPIKKVYGTISKNPYGKRYNTKEVSIRLYSKQFWHYWEIKAKEERVYFELYANKEL